MGLPLNYRVSKTVYLSNKANIGHIRIIDESTSISTRLQSLWFSSRHVTCWNWLHRHEGTNNIFNFYYAFRILNNKEHTGDLLLDDNRTVKLVRLQRQNTSQVFLGFPTSGCMKRLYFLRDCIKDKSWVASQ